MHMRFNLKVFSVCVPFRISLHTFCFTSAAFIIADGCVGKSGTQIGLLVQVNSTVLFNRLIYVVACGSSLLVAYMTEVSRPAMRRKTYAGCGDKNMFGVRCRVA
jgi:hypothetical protein